MMLDRATSVVNRLGRMDFSAMTRSEVPLRSTTSLPG